VLAYGLAWLFWIPVALTGQDYQESPLLMAAMFLGVFGPGLAGIILTYGEEGKQGRRDFWRRAFDLRRIRPRWYVVIVLLWPVLHIAAIAVTRLLGGSMPELGFLRELAAQPVQIPVVIVLYFLQAGLEELGWRGYLLERVQPGRGPLRASLLVGLFHAPWHLPAFWIVGTNQIEMGFGVDFLLFVATVLAFSVVTTWCYNDNGHSTMAATLLHTTGNLCLDAFTDGPGTLQFRLYALLMVLGAVAIGAVWAGRDRVGRNAEVVLQGSSAVADP
jgi:membrane protease YdiL (CAAX protease family)